MKPSIWTAAGLALAAAAFAPVAQADDGFKADAVTCAGVYDAIADSSRVLLAFFPDLNKTNFGEIDFGARGEKLLADKDVEAHYMEPFKTYKTMLTYAGINRKPKDLREVLALSVRCDRALGFKPSYSADPR
jgi:hypothetical protein